MQLADYSGYPGAMDSGYPCDALMALVSKMRCVRDTGASRDHIRRVLVSHYNDTPWDFDNIVDELRAGLTPAQAAQAALGCPNVL